jgi:hypothetical protein
VHLEFYRSAAHGTRVLTQNVTATNLSFEQAIDNAKSLLRESSLALGNATVCLIKSQDGTRVREVLK